eukprot:CAMPEP_0198294120 /NCGR_PEP_ID=MMETSP1449-20131203/20800_1 /TAXON_ID=420275 /ORGANISM="Attheya septentrionalis, Strain CCMP2084" /LENGTH=140 /DNA_ID=CAMNT_0043993979 /DNA_START=800 /DNA_END=1222 /DNA_ORIENTATION=+
MSLFVHLFLGVIRLGGEPCILTIRCGTVHHHTFVIVVTGTITNNGSIGDGQTPSVVLGQESSFRGSMGPIPPNPIPPIMTPRSLFHTRQESPQDRRRTRQTKHLNQSHLPTRRRRMILLIEILRIMTTRSMIVMMVIVGK